MMFKFPLQRLLDLKSKREQAMARALAEARRQELIEADRRDALVALRDESNHQVAAGAEGSLSVGELVSMRHALTQMAEHLDAAEQRTDAARQQAEARNGELSGAVQERQVLDRLRGRRLDQHRAEETHQDRNAMDAVALARFHSSRSDNNAPPKEK